MSGRTAIWWLRRDLRLGDNPALAAAAALGDVVPLFVLDPALLGQAGSPRVAFLLGCLEELAHDSNGALVVRSGDPCEVVARVATEIDAAAVFVARDAGPYGRRRDAAVGARLDDIGVAMTAVGSPYAVEPGTLRTGSGGPYRVFTPFSRAWSAHGWPDPIDAPHNLVWARGIQSEQLDPAHRELLSPPVPGERAALDRLHEFLDRVEGYAVGRNRPDLDETSRLSPYLKFGCLHPRQVLGHLGTTAGDSAFRRELCWRDFYADVLRNQPQSAWREMQPHMATIDIDGGDAAAQRFDAWAEGRTGYPLVDAGMRQLRIEGWMHNRVRMLVASFLVKHLHLDWRRGAREFMKRLVDGDLASNSHGWQWTAGTGTDPAPYTRVFNPTLQAEKFDPDGHYIRRYVPELRGVRAPDIHRPWSIVGGPPAGYPMPIVDLRTERTEALARYAAARSGT